MGGVAPDDRLATGRPRGLDRRPVLARTTLPASAPPLNRSGIRSTHLAILPAAGAFGGSAGRRPVQFKVWEGFLLSGFRPICGLFFSSVTAFIREFHERFRSGV
jgi:hypothetical protein